MNPDMVVVVLGRHSSTFVDFGSRTDYYIEASRTYKNMDRIPQSSSSAD